jgi:hypothetical protein
VTTEGTEEDAEKNISKTAAPTSIWRDDGRGSFIVASEIERLRRDVTGCIFL